MAKRSSFAPSVPAGPQERVGGRRAVPVESGPWQPPPHNALVELGFVAWPLTLCGSVSVNIVL